MTTTGSERSNVSPTSPRRSYDEPVVTRDGHRLHVRDHPGRGPAVLLLHGFPDNLHLYDHVVDRLEGIRTITFDFLGYGASDKPAGHRYTFDGVTRDLAAVIDTLALDDVVLVPHDYSGLPAFDWALSNRDRVAGMVLLNTFYGNWPGLRTPEAIFLFSRPGLRVVARPVSARFDLFARLYRWQIGTRFITEPEVARAMVPTLLAQFEATPSAKQAFFDLNADLRSAIGLRTGRASELAALDVPVDVVFGELDHTLTGDLGRYVASLLPDARLRPIADAGHFPQLDRPAIVAQRILGLVGRTA